MIRPQEVVKEGRPFIHVNFAIDACGHWENHASAISCETDWRRVHELREKYDAVAVGGATWNRDHPRLSVRRERLGREPKRQPARVIFAGGHDCFISPGANNTYVVGSTPPSGGTAAFICADEHQLQGPLHTLWREGTRSMLVEGGPRLIRSFLDQHIADSITVFVRTKCAEVAMRVACNAMGELPAGINIERLGEGILLSWQATRGTWNERETSEPVRFVILAAPRTGSNMLCSMLNSHPQILCHHEIFNPLGMHYALDHRDGEINLGCVSERDQNPELFLHRLWRHSCGKRAVGLKLNRGQNKLAFQSVLEDVAIRKIILSRRNRLKTFISELIAQQTGYWESYNSSQRNTDTACVRVDLSQFMDHVATNHDYYARIREFLRSTRQQVLEIVYEDLSLPEEQLRILNFLGISSCAAALYPSTKKMNSSNLKDLVSNFEELQTALLGSGFECELQHRDFVQPQTVNSSLPSVHHDY